MARDIATSMTPSRRLGPRGGDRVRSTAHGLSKVDAALLGAALVILGERVNSASGDGSLRILPAGLKSVSADQNFELSLSSLRNANAEVSLLSSLVSSVRKDVSEELGIEDRAGGQRRVYLQDTARRRPRAVPRRRREAGQRDRARCRRRRQRQR